MKYIVFSDPSENEHIVLFSSALTHHAVATAMQEACPTHKLTAISAGQITEDMTCCGESQTLHLRSRRQDDTLLLKIAMRVN